MPTIMPEDILKEVASPVAIVLIFVFYLYKRDSEERQSRADMLREHRETIERIVAQHEETTRQVVLDSSSSHKDKTVAFLQAENRSKDIIERVVLERKRNTFHNA